MISTRYARAVIALLVVALVPTIIHSYAGLRQDDGIDSSKISTSLASYVGTPSGRDAEWGQRRFEATDWFERQYRVDGREVLLTVIRSHDLKKLYHHPELDVAYGAGYLTHEVVHL